MKDIDILIRENGAIPDKLLRRCQELRVIPFERVLEYARQWYPITESLGLAASGYLGVVVNEIRAADGTRRLALEEVLQRAAAIAADDLGLFRGACDGDAGPIHFRLFERMCEKLGPISNNVKLLPETIRLRDEVRNLFGTIAGGIAGFRVIEPIAHKVVEHQLPLFLAAEREDKKVYCENDLDYITLHLRIEGEHAAESETLVGSLLGGGISAKKIEDGVKSLSVRFGDYWAALERHVLD